MEFANFVIIHCNLHKCRPSVCNSLFQQMRDMFTQKYKRKPSEEEIFTALKMYEYNPRAFKNWIGNPKKYEKGCCRLSEFVLEYLETFKGRRDCDHDEKTAIGYVLDFYFITVLENEEKEATCWDCQQLFHQLKEHVEKAQQKYQNQK